MKPHVHGPKIQLKSTSQVGAQSGHTQVLLLLYWPAECRVQRPGGQVWTLVEDTPFNELSTCQELCYKNGFIMFFPVLNNSDTKLSTIPLFSKYISISHNWTKENVHCITSPRARTMEAAATDSLRCLISFSWCEGNKPGPCWVEEVLAAVEVKTIWGEMDGIEMLRL